MLAQLAIESHFSSDDVVCQKQRLRDIGSGAASRSTEADAVLKPPGRQTPGSSGPACLTIVGLTGRPRIPRYALVPE